MAAKVKTATAEPTSLAMAFDLPALNVRSMEVCIIGDSPLIVNAWSEKAKRQILDKQMKKASKAKEAKNPEEDFRNSMYHLPGGKTGFPIIGIKSCAVTGVSTLSGITKVLTRQAFHLRGEFAILEGEPPTMREDMVRVSMGKTDIRFRAQYWPWWLTFTCDFNPDVMSPAQILNLFNIGGFGVGIGEYRPEKDGGFGRFHVASESEMLTITRERERLEAPARARNGRKAA